MATIEKKRKAVHHESFARSRNLSMRTMAIERLRAEKEGKRPTTPKVL